MRRKFDTNVNMDETDPSNSIDFANRPKMMLNESYQYVDTT